MMIIDLWPTAFAFRIMNIHDTVININLPATFDDTDLMYKKNHFLLVVCLLCSSCCSLYGQQFLQPSAVEGEPLGVQQGLSQGMINCIYHDKEGYMWICTKDGLNRYDGYNIITYRNNTNDSKSLPDNYCNATQEDDNGNFWVATNTKGLFFFDKATESFYPVTVVNNNKENLCIRELDYANGKLFVQTWTNALILDVSQVSLKKDKNAGAKARLIFNYNQSQPNKQYRMGTNIYSNMTWRWMHHNVLWVCFPDSIFYLAPVAGLSQWNVTAFTQSSLGITESKYGSVSIYPIKDEPENIVIASNNTIIHFNTVARQVLFKKILPESKPVAFNKNYNVNDGSICWLTDSQVYIYNPKTRGTEIVTANNRSLLKGTVISLYTDANGIQWYGTSGLGIIKKDLRKKRFKSIIGANQTDVFWKLPPVYMPNVSPQLRGKRIVLDNKGTYWAYLNGSSSSHKPSLFSNDTHTGITTLYSGLPHFYNVLANIYNDPADRLWVYYQDFSKKNHIARIDKTAGHIIETYSLPESIESPEPYVTQFYSDNNGMMWLATINGLYALDEKSKTWKHWKNIPGNNSSISSDGVLSICPDPISPDKYLWIGTEGTGFNRFDKSTGNCIRYDEKDGLPNNVAYCILSDSLNNLWISTNKGLSCFNTVQKTFRNFTDEDGLPGNEFNRGAAMRMQNGELMFEGVNGLVIFNPNEVLQKQPAAPMVFTGVTVLNKPVNWKTDSSNLEGPVNYAKKLTLKPGQNIFSISFATLEYRSNAKKMYKYKLEGFDKGWTNPGSKNEVTYTNLSPGTYTFQVMGANTDGVWNEKPISLKITVLPYWYQTLLCKIALLSLLGAALYAFYRYRLRQGLKLEKLRNRIARDLHDEIGSTLSSISIYAASAKKVAAGNQKAEAILSKINAGTSEMMEAMSDIVWAVNTSNDHFDNLANRMRSFAVQVTEAKNIELQFTDNKDIPDVSLGMEQRKNIYLICKEAISNAVKYSDCTLLQVRIIIQHHQLFIQVQDNGRGFVLNNPEAIIPGHSFGGNGIKNMQGRAAEIDASLEIITKAGNGTSVVLSLPLKKS